MLEVAKESLPYWAFGLFFVLYRWLDVVMLSLLTQSEVVGWYSVPTRLFQTLMFLPVVVSTAWLPRFVRGFAGGEPSLRELVVVSAGLMLVGHLLFDHGSIRRATLGMITAVAMWCISLAVCSLGRRSRC
jgi:O-antigen/teichoic acid export membrane protein